MKRFALVALGLGALVVGVLLQSSTAQGQMPQASPAGKNGFRATLVGVAASDFAKSRAFYEHIMGFPVAFKFSSADGTRTNLFFQMGRNSFIEMQVAGGDVKPGLTHAHFVVDDLTATLAKLRQAGLAAAGRGGRPANAVGEQGYSQNIFTKNGNVYDPDGIRLELNELTPESLIKKAADSWTAAQETKALNLNVVGVGASDLVVSAKFYQELLAFRTPFKFGGPDPQRISYYLQPSRDTFVELQHVAANATPGLSHFHLVTANLDATIARLKQAGLTAAAGNTPGTIGQTVGVSPGAKTKNINVYDPNGIRIELNEYDSASLPKQAVDAWQ
jgi:catechol 2,3-dioxygenase-like lactoylglutathione lyase family enzyme